MPFGSNDDDDSMSFAKLKAYLQNPETIVPAVKDTLQNGDLSDQAMAKDQLKMMNLGDKSYEPSQDDIAKQMDKNEMLQSMATGTMGSINVKPNLGSAGGHVIENVNPAKFRETLADLVNGQAAAENAGDSGAVNHFADVINRTFTNNKAGKIHTPVSSDAMSNIMKYISK